jgi:hypothetical protein
MKNLLWLLAAPILITSCKKDSDSNPTPTPNPGSSACLLEEERDSVGNKLTTSYEYDANRRLIKQFSYREGVKSGYANFTYSGSTLTIQDYKMDNSADGSPSIGSLNSSGYLTDLKSSRPDTVNGTPGIAKDTTTFTYNGSGQMTSYSIRSWTRTSSGTFLARYSMMLSYEYNSGRAFKTSNSFSETKGSVTQSSSSVTTYTFNESSPVVQSNPVIDLFSLSGTNLFGKLKADRIPVKADVTYELDGQTSTSTTTYNSVVDSKGNPTKIRSFTDFGGGFGFGQTDLYSYKCP